MAALAVPSFAFGNGFAAKTPQDVARNRAVYQALLTGGTKPVSLGTGLTAVGEAIVARLANERANDAETAGLSQAQKEFQALQGGNDPAALATAMADPWVQENKGMAATVGALQARQLDQSDPAYQADLAYKIAQTDALKAKPAVTPTDDMRELEQINTERTAAGKPSLSMEDFLASKKGQGLQVVTNPDGTTSISMGGAGVPKLTEGQSKDAFYYIRGAGANENLTANESALTSLGDTVAGKVPLVGNYFASDGFKNANRDAKEFLAAVLRKDSGGAITSDEWNSYGPMYIPAPGDGPEQLANKKEARDRAMDALKVTSGPGQVVIDEFNRQHPKKGVAKKTKVIDGATYTQDENGDWNY